MADYDVIRVRQNGHLAASPGAQGRPVVVGRSGDRLRARAALSEHRPRLLADRADHRHRLARHRASQRRASGRRR
jgi:hypothetical protein